MSGNDSSNDTEKDKKVGPAVTVKEVPRRQKTDKARDRLLKNALINSYNTPKPAAAKVTEGAVSASTSRPTSTSVSSQAPEPPPPPIPEDVKNERRKEAQDKHAAFKTIQDMSPLTLTNMRVKLTAQNDAMPGLFMALKDQIQDAFDNRRMSKKEVDDASKEYRALHAEYSALIRTNLQLFFTSVQESQKFYNKLEVISMKLAALSNINVCIMWWAHTYTKDPDRSKYEDALNAIADVKGIQHDLYKYLSTLNESSEISTPGVINQWSLINLQADILYLAMKNISVETIDQPLIKQILSVSASFRELSSKWESLTVDQRNVEFRKYRDQAKELLVLTIETPVASATTPRKLQN